MNILGIDLFLTIAAFEQSFVSSWQQGSFLVLLGRKLEKSKVKFKPWFPLQLNLITNVLIMLGIHLASHSRSIAPDL